MEQMTIFDLMNEEFHINKPIRLIELFGGIGSQAMALKSLGLDFESYRLVEIDKYAVASYNAIHGTDFVPTDITQLKGEDLGIVDTDKYIYLLTYSFPCQSLSVAGLGHGMEEGSGTRSSLLWEVKRLLTETKNKPQILLMENVPQVHSEGKNLKSFIKWQQFLESLGYISFTEDIQANQYVAQSRNRCFCISLLGKYTYHFPQGHTCDKVMKDYLEDEVDEKYYITSEKAHELIDKLVKEGKIPVDRQTDRQTDRQLSCLSNQDQSIEPTQSLQEKTGAFQESVVKDQELLSMGFLTDKPHESTEVFSEEGASRCLQATENKHPQKIIQVKRI